MPTPDITPTRPSSGPSIGERDDRPALALRLRHKLMFSVGFALVTLLIGALVVESLYNPHRSFDFPFGNKLYPYVGFRPPSNYTWQSDRPSSSSRGQRRAIAYTNEDGLRIAAPGVLLPKMKPLGTIRVAMLGGSTVRTGTDFAVALPGALQRELDQRFPGGGIEVLNAGISSAIARQQLIQLITNVVDYDVDIIINYDGINDSGQMLYYEHRPNYPYNFKVVENAWDEYVGAQRDSIWRVLVNRSVIASWLFPERFGHVYFANSIPASRVIDEPDLRACYAAAYIDSWDKIRRVCEAYGITPFFILQPTSLYSVDEQGNQNGMLSDYHRANYLIYETFRHEVGKFAAAHPEVGVADLSTFLPSVDYFYDGCHVYDEVNDRIARRIADMISPALRRIPQRLVRGRPLAVLDRRPALRPFVAEPALYAKRQGSLRRFAQLAWTLSPTFFCHLSNIPPALDSRQCLVYVRI